MLAKLEIPSLGLSVDILHARVNATADGNNTVIPAVPAKRLLVLGYVLTVTAAGAIALQDGQATPAVHAQLSLPANGVAIYAGGRDAPAFELAASQALVINNPVGVDTLGHVTYVEL